MMVTTFKTYTADTGMIVFEQSFPTEIPSAGQELIEAHDNTDHCRVTTGKFTLTGSTKGYSAWTVSGGKTTNHGGQYCGDGKDQHADVAWSSNNGNQSDCAAACAKHSCDCFDFIYGGKPHPHPSHGPSAQSAFPNFARNSGPTDAWDTFSYHGVFPGMEAAKFADYTETHQGGAPLAIYDGSDATLPMVVLSPLGDAKAHHMTTTSTSVGAGVKATVTLIPSGWKQSFILSSGAGINDGMQAWGDRMLKFTGKQRADMYKDQTHSTIGFWTDNGGYYHYATDAKKDTYEEVLPKVKAYHDSLGVPFGHWQFDSWFYPKDGSVNAGGGGGSVLNWTSMDSVFPSGMAAIQQKLGVPMVMHNRQWSDKSDYVKNWPEIKWYGPKDSAEPSEFAMAVDPAQFFTKFFTQQEGWGLTMYEQDWMNKEYDGVKALQTNISLGDMWLHGMAIGAGSPGSERTIQYCMPYAHDILSAAAYPEVTNARATGDYFHAGNQWAVGATSLFYWAIGILPFKDGFYSSNLPQVGGQTVGPEMNPDREILMATLSCAMVGPMDGINLLNASRVMTSCRKDGRVLKPDKPVSTMDTCFLNKWLSPGSCYNYHTYSDIAGIGRVSYAFQNTPATLSSADIYVSSADSYAVYDWYNGGGVVKLGAATPMTSGYEEHAYAVVSPVLSNGWVFVGETNKYVSASSTRFPSATSDSKSLTVQVVGVASETVTVCAAHSSAMSKLVCVKQQFTTAGTKAVTFPPAGDVEVAQV